MRARNPDSHPHTSDTVQPHEPDAADAPEDAAPELPLTRRERRAAARGGAAAAKVPGQRGVRLPPPPIKHRDYAARKHG